MTLFFNETATTEIYTYGHTLSLRDALPICRVSPDFRPSCRNSPGWSLAREEDDVMPQFEDAQAQRAEARFIRQSMAEPLLSRDREYRLARSWREAGDADSLPELIRAYTRLVVLLAPTFPNIGLPLRRHSGVSGTR